MKYVPAKPVEFTIFNEEESSLLVDHYKGGPGYLYHFHQGMELVLMRGSIGRRIIDNKTETYQNRDLILVGSNQAHTWDSEPAMGDTEPKDVTVIHFSKKSLGYELLNKNEFRKVAQMLKKAKGGLCFGLEAVELVEPLLIQMIEEDPMKKFLLFLEVLIILSESSCRVIIDPDSREEKQPADFQLMGEVLIYLRENSGQKITLDQTASDFNMSVSTFSRFFKRVNGISFIEYLNRQQVDRAALLLKNTDLKIVDICMAAGYRNHSHFNRQFLRITGNTPAEYRKNHTTKPLH